MLFNFSKKDKKIKCIVIDCILAYEFKRKILSDKIYKELFYFIIRYFLFLLFIYNKKNLNIKF